LVLDDPDNLFKPVPPPVPPEAVFVSSDVPGAEIQAH
jgi:hypothetical protein